MKRKDCDHLNNRVSTRTSARRSWIARIGSSCALIIAFCSTTAWGGSIRMWSSAVVVHENILLSDLAESRAFEVDLEGLLGELVVAEAPPVGGSRIIHRDMIRSVVEASGANMAEVTIRGATQCTVTRPGKLKKDSPVKESRAQRESHKLHDATRSRVKGKSQPTNTLRNAVIRYFNGELSRYGGTAEVVFNRASSHVLDLSGPDYRFVVRRRSSVPLGLIQAEVDVIAGGVTVQSVPLVVQVSMARRVVVSRRSINQGATIRPVDIELVLLRFSRVDNLGIGDPTQAVGQRARRFIAAGSIVKSGLLESVPLVMRGQLVTLRSIAGAVQVVTTVKARKSGLLGESIPVRSTDKRRVEFDAVVVGPAAVQIGGATNVRPSGSLSLGGDS